MSNQDVGFIEAVCDLCKQKHKIEADQVLKCPQSRGPHNSNFLYRHTGDATVTQVSNPADIPPILKAKQKK